ncbi:hypothetical protein F5Y19DRAFT_135141 [Xylariaceae sp. FL1651]|nr:hypothetical protein F5Y19DRAFT_135141 [Xylariaceae sp. FL1651]
MHFTKPFKSSPHSLPSPDGRYVATLLPPNLIIRSVGSLGILRTIKLPPDLSGGVTSFVWSPLSTRVLVAVADQLHIFSATGGDLYGLVQIPQPLAAKSAFVQFGDTDDEVCVWSPLGIKLTIINLISSKAVEINNPKFYVGMSASRGCSFRSGTHHLALLTRTLGKDMISIHPAETREVQRSWSPDTVDAQGLAWTPDGKWLVVWESPAHGNRVLYYTPDGHIFKDWHGSRLLRPALADMDQYGSGVKTLGFSPNGRYTAVANGSDCIYILNDRLVEEKMLHHAQVVEPKDTLQLWQEQINPRAGQPVVPTFVRATQAISPPGLSSNGMSDVRAGCNLVKFDSSSSLLASRLDDAPSTIWIWDVLTSELRAVLMYHANVTKVEWHPSQPELLLMRCEGEEHSGLIFVWDPLSDGPRPIELLRHLPSAKVNGRIYVTWLKTATGSAALFFKDHATCILVSLADTDETPPWEEQSTVALHVDKDSPADLNIQHDNLSDYSSSDTCEGNSELDDTFHFKKSPLP